MSEPRGPGGVCPYNIDDAVAAEIYRWGADSLGVRYYFPGDKWKAREIGFADWPVIDRLDREGHLLYENDDVRRLWRASRERSS
jgi:hypothetical protein